MGNDQQLKKTRDQIDLVDAQLQQLINQRAELALQVGKVKRAEEDAPIFYRPEREAKILQKIIANNKGPLHDKQIIAIFRAVLTACLTLQQPIKVACLGPEGTYSQMAVFKHFGVETSAILVPTIDRIFREIAAEDVDYGVVPIENSTAGVINATLDLLISSNFTICGEIILPIHLHLLRSADNDAPIQHIYAHEQALQQSARWLDEHYSDVTTIAVSSNGAAAKLAKEEINAAAIAGDLAVEHYGLTAIVRNIEDNPHNETRFIILGKQKVDPSGFDKTSLLISTPNVPGSLLEVLKPFSDQSINISQIASRPYRHRQWSYLFFLDIEGHQDDPSVKLALAALSKKPMMVNVLGSYPKAVL